MKGLYLLLVVLLFAGCEKESIPGKGDYKDAYTGLFHFTAIKKIISMCYDSSSTCIDGWEVLITDTTYIKSEITKYESDKLEIQFGDGYIGSFNGSPIPLIIYPILSKNGELIGHSDLAHPGISPRVFQGNFIGYDSLDIYFEFRTGGMGAYYKYQILGIRINRHNYR